MNPNGIPSVGDFPSSVKDGDRPRGVHAPSGWLVDGALNVVRSEQLSGRAVNAFGARPANYDAMIRAAAHRDPEREAVVCGDRRINWREFDVLIEKYARGLVARGLSVGDRVAVMLDNRLEFLIITLATIRAGGIAVPMGVRLGRDDVAHIVADAEPTIAVTAMAWKDRFPPPWHAERLFLVDAVGDASDLSSLLALAPGELPALEQEAPMMIIYTSGTTGKPKGAVLTHANFVHTCLHYIYSLALDRPQRSLLAVPATHIAGFGPAVSVILAGGGTIVLMREFKARAALEMIERERISYAVMVPAMYQLCVLDPSFADHDLSSWTYAVYGGAIMPPAVIEAVGQRLPALRLINAYGATETCAVCTIMPPECTTSVPASVGLPLQCDELLIVDEDGNPVPDGQPGELLIRGPNVSPGYWRNPEATSRAFRDGYWVSGDIATRDERGFYLIHDRLKDMINRGGFKVFSAEVENALMAHPNVADCAVVAVPDAVLGERTFAMVSRRTVDLDGPTLRAFLIERIADYKIPDFWHVTEETIPRNQNGKQQKTEVRRVADEMLANHKTVRAG